MTTLMEKAKKFFEEKGWSIFEGANQSTDLEWIGVRPGTTEIVEMLGKEVPEKWLREFEYRIHMTEGKYYLSPPGAGGNHPVFNEFREANEWHPDSW